MHGAAEGDDTSQGDVRDRSVEEDESPQPGIGLDQDTPMGDTPEHSEADGDPLGDEASMRPTPRFRRLIRRESVEK
jgi:hypothetical protein